jgi:hypothetical protein
MMVTKTKGKVKRKKRSNTLTVVKVEHVQVPDAQERLSRVFKILLSSLNEIEEKR